MASSHPIFARVFDLACPLMEREAGARRAELLAGLQGRVVEIGAGNGANFRHYPTTVSDVVAIEPDAFLRRKAIQSARRAPVSVSVRDGSAERLDLDVGSVDAAVACLVLCSVPSPSQALAEIRRVLKPGGELRFLEHVRSPHARNARLQQWLDDTGVWPRVGGGCHCARDTIRSIEDAGFVIELMRHVNLGPAWMHTNPHVLGTSRAPRLTGAT
jgi:ubiquinone/menaquinone biosynthesis C-methylase UbiE